MKLLYPVYAITTADGTFYCSEKWRVVLTIGERKWWVGGPDVNYIDRHVPAYEPDEIILGPHLAVQDRRAVNYL